MAKRTIIPVGTQFGRLTTIGNVFMSEGDKRSRVQCVCTCGNTCTVRTETLKRGESQSCGCLARELTSARFSALSGDKSRMWRGGKYTEKNSGYVYTYVGKGNHPRLPNKTHVREHILVMEASLGRCLYPGENVHHKNGVKDDNRPENLELWVTSQPAGQRPEDLVAWAHEILDRYEKEA